MQIQVISDNRSCSFHGVGKGNVFTNGNLRHLYKEKFMPCIFRQKNRGGQRALPVLAVSQAPSAQNNPAEVAQLGVAYSDPLQS